MTREAIVQREKKRKNLTEKFSEKRKKIKDQLKKQDLSFEDAMELRKKPVSYTHLTLPTICSV